MRKFIPTLTLATTLALASFSAAGPRQHKATPPTSLLTEGEHLCQTLGSIAYKQATARDAGVPYTQLLASLRSTLAKMEAPNPLTIQLSQLMLAVLRVTYDRPQATPALVQQQTELLCLGMVEKQLGSTPTVAKDRY